MLSPLVLRASHAYKAHKRVSTTSGSGRNRWRRVGFTETTHVAPTTEKKSNPAANLKKQ
jgi:hypothetical protein